MGERVPPPNLIPCPDCTARISADAETCPYCGRVNDWVHPKLHGVINFLNEQPGQTTYEARGQVRFLKVG